LNVLLFNPVLFCLKKTGPLDSNFIKKLNIGTNQDNRKIMVKRENMTSNNRLKNNAPFFSEGNRKDL